MFDTHTHLNADNLYPHRREHITNFQQHWWIWLINVWTNSVFNKRGLEISQIWSQEFPDMVIKNTIWLHPYEASVWHITAQTLDSTLEELQSLLTEENLYHIVAIGEIGIDTHYPWSEQYLDLQQELFKQQLELARQYKLPVVIHSRANREATHEILRHYKDITIHFHCRWYWPKELQIIQNHYPDYYIGFCSNITYPKATELRKSLRYLIYKNENYPDYIISKKSKNILVNDFSAPVRIKKKDWKRNRILIETDAPYLPPQALRWQTNYPIHIIHTYRYASQLLWYDIVQHVTQNTKKCYQIEKELL